MLVHCRFILFLVEHGFIVRNAPSKCIVLVLKAFELFTILEACPVFVPRAVLLRVHGNHRHLAPSGQPPHSIVEHLPNSDERTNVTVTFRQQSEKRTMQRGTKRLNLFLLCRLQPANYNHLWSNTFLIFIEYFIHIFSFPFFFGFVFRGLHSLIKDVVHYYNMNVVFNYNISLSQYLERDLLYCIVLIQSNKVGVYP